MKLVAPVLPQPTGDMNAWARQTIKVLQEYLNRSLTQINLTSEGFITGATNAATAVPTTGTYAAGDFVRNSAPSEAGSAGSKYVVFGWLCVTGGTPGAWKACRFLTGN